MLSLLIETVSLQHDVRVVVPCEILLGRENIRPKHLRNYMFKCVLKCNIQCVFNCVHKCVFKCVLSYVFKCIQEYMKCNIFIFNARLEKHDFGNLNAETCSWITSIDK